jgi:hypothetical protein
MTAESAAGDQYAANLFLLLLLLTVLHSAQTGLCVVQEQSLVSCQRKLLHKTRCLLLKVRFYSVSYALLLTLMQFVEAVFN